jgi:gliding motility-associated-like protein
MKFYALLFSFLVISFISKAQCGPADFTVSDTCTNISTSFFGSGGDVNSVYTWDFGDPTSGSFNIATGQNPQHFFATPGTYNVTLTISGTCAGTVTIPVNITTTPIAVDLQDILVCTVPFNLTANGGSAGSTYLWSNGKTGVDMSSISISDGGTYWVKTTLNGCSAGDTAKVGVWGQGNHGDYTWNFGNGGLDFSTNPPTVISGSVITTGASSISDRSGDLLFYTDGQAVYDKNNVPMPNGLGILGTSASQPTLIVPDSRTSNIYYVFAESPTTGLSYSVVDMSKNNGLGDVVNKNIPIVPAATAGVLAGLSDSAGGFWTVTYDAAANTLVSIMNKNGIFNVSAPGSASGITMTTPPGALKFSSDGTKAVLTVPGQNTAVVYDFNRTTGQFTNPVTITVNSPSGAEFAPDNSELYISTGPDHNLYQYDLSAAPPAGVVIANNPSANYGEMRLGPDGRIYVEVNGAPSGFGIINSPEFPGSQSDYTFSSSTVSINPYLPNMVADYFTSTSWGIRYADTCQGAPTRFLGTAPDSVRTWTWSFDDGTVLPASANPYVTHTFATAGNHSASVFVTHHCGDTTMTVNFKILAAPVATLPLTMTVCTGDSVQLDAGNPGATYLWSNGATTQTTYIHSPSGKSYVTKAFGACQFTDTTNITFLNAPVLNLGNDTTLCFGQTLLLDVGTYPSAPAAPTIGWSTGASSQTITVAASGTYFANIIYPSCTITDTIKVTVLPKLDASLGANDTLCNGLSKTLSNNLNPYTGVNYLWSTGASGNSISVSSSNDYNLAVSLDHCVAKDTVHVEFVNIPVNNLGSDSSLCSGTVTTLNAGNPGYSYLWNDGTTAMTRTVSSPSPNSPWSDTYSVDVKKGNCVRTFSVNYTYIARPVVTLGPDQILCQGNVDVLNALNPGYSYQWSTGATSQTIQVTTSGQYFVDVYKGSCHGKDTVNFTFNPSPTATLPAEITFCKDKVPSVLISVGGASASYSYTWQPAGLGTNDNITVTQEGVYSVVVHLGNCASPTLSTHVVSICEPHIFVPSAFSPNGDGNNEIFQVYGESVEKYELRIFDRWGELIFVSTSINDSWDGKYRQKMVEEGVYIWKLEYSGKTENGLSKHVLEGDVTVLR